MDSTAGEMKQRPIPYLDTAYLAVGHLVHAMALQPIPELDGPGESEVSALEEKVSKLEYSLGARKLAILRNADAPGTVRYDSYGRSAVDEIYGTGTAFCKAVSRAYVYLDALRAHDNPEDLTVERRPDGFRKIIRSELWDLIEVGYFRAAALWDRVGQLLEFVFFRVRDYRDGFSGTIKRMKANFDVDGLPFPALHESRDWLFLKDFESKEHSKLTSKRNVFAHRRAFQEESGIAEDLDARVLFVPFTDHLGVVAGKFEDAEGELVYLREHSRTIWTGAAAAVSVCLWWLENGAGGRDETPGVLAL